MIRAEQLRNGSPLHLFEMNSNDLVEVTTKLHAAVEMMKQANRDNPNIAKWEEQLKKLTAVTLRNSDLRKFISIAIESSAMTELYQMRIDILEQELSLYRAPAATLAEVMYNRAEDLVTEMTNDKKKSKGFLARLAEYPELKTLLEKVINKPSPQVETQQ